MKSVKFLSMVAFLAVSVLYVKAQGLSKINEASFFSTKFNKEKVWDAQYAPVTPVECKIWSHPDTHSGNIRTVIPETSGQPFWKYPDSDSGIIRTKN